jgi:hypothetical protein
MKLKTKSFYLIITLLLLNACGTDDSRNLDFDVSDIDIGDFKIERYEQDLFKIEPNNIKEGLEAIQQKYLIFLAADLNKEQNLNQIQDFITDPELLGAYQETVIKFPDLKTLTAELESAFKYYKYHFPSRPTPKTYTYISGFEYDYPIQMADDVLIIGLDLYLGKDFNTYRQIGIPEYKIERMQADHISVDCMKEIASHLILFDRKNTTFLDEIVNYGKVMYFLDATLPLKEDYLKMAYTPEQLNWINENEPNLWAFIIDNQVLFSSDYEIIRKFMSDGPFTAAFSKKAPARIGGWFGWQIVRAYMNSHPEISIDELFKNTDARLIFSQSKYKPRK